MLPYIGLNVNCYKSKVAQNEKKLFVLFGFLDNFTKHKYFKYPISEVWYQNAFT